MVKWGPHIVLGVGGTFIVLSPDVSSIFLTGLYSAIGSVLPDLDLKLRHRKLLHNMPSLILLLTVIVVYLQIFEEYTLSETFKVWAPLSIGYTLHLAVDSFTKMGIRPLWPFSPFRLVLSEFNYDDPKLNIFVSLIGILLIVYYIYHEFLL